MKLPPPPDFSPGSFKRCMKNWEAIALLLFSSLATADAVLWKFGVNSQRSDWNEGETIPFLVVTDLGNSIRYGWQKPSAIGFGVEIKKKRTGELLDSFSISIPADTTVATFDISGSLTEDEDYEDDVIWLGFTVQGIGGTTVKINSSKYVSEGQGGRNDDIGLKDYVIPTFFSAEISIIDNDEPPPPPINISLSAGLTQINEGSSGEFSVDLSRAIDTDLSVSISSSALGYTEGSDYSVSSSVTIPAGETSATGTVSANQDDDALDELFRVRIGSVSGSSERFEKGGQLIFKILDDEYAEAGPLKISLSANRRTVTEGSSVSFTVALTGLAPTDLSIPISISGAEDGDINNPNEFTVRINEGVRSSGFLVIALHDADDNDETFTVAIGSLPDGISPGSQTSVSVTINEFDLEEDRERNPDSYVNPIELRQEEEGALIITSTRALVGTGTNLLFGYFTIRGSPRLVLVQAVGPELDRPNAPESNALADPFLRIYSRDPSKLLAENDNWEDTQRQDIIDAWGGSPNLDAGSKSSAIILTLEPGDYSAIVSSKNGLAGVARIEIFDLDLD